MNSTVCWLYGIHLAGIARMGFKVSVSINTDSDWTRMLDKSYVSPFHLYTDVSYYIFIARQIYSVALA